MAARLYTASGCRHPFSYHAEAITPSPPPPLNAPSLLLQQNKLISAANKQKNRIQCPVRRHRKVSICLFEFFEGD